MKEIFAFYNVENLFPPDPTPIHKTDPTPSGMRNWDERKYNTKLGRIARVFQLIKEEEGILPALIGLAEVHGREPMEALVACQVFEGYEIVHFPSMDRRGMDVALLCNPARLKLISAEPLSFVDAELFNADELTRDILHCRFEFLEETINVFVLHLPSKRNQDVNLKLRNHILEGLQGKLSEIGKNGEAVMICGDFNANPDDENVINLVCGDGTGKGLINPFRIKFEEESYSGFHGTEGLLFDQMIFSEDFFLENFVLKFEAAKVFNHEKLRNRDRKYAARPARTFAGTRYLGGYSDHFPVLTEFKINI